MPDTRTADLADLQQAAAEAAALLKALANEERLLLLCQLSQGEFCVGELEEMLGIYQPTLSQQLGVLRRQELVDTRRDGKQIYYRLSNPRALAVLETLYAQFCGQPGGRK